MFAAAYLVVLTDCHSAVATAAACWADFDRTVAALEAGHYFEIESHSVVEVERIRPVADSYFDFAAVALAAYSAGFDRSAALAGSHSVAEVQGSCPVAGHYFDFAAVALAAYSAGFGCSAALGAGSRSVAERPAAAAAAAVVEQAAVGNQPVAVELVAQVIVLRPAAEEFVAVVEAKIAANQCPAVV